MHSEVEGLAEIIALGEQVLIPSNRVMHSELLKKNGMMMMMMSLNPLESGHAFRERGSGVQE